MTPQEFDYIKRAVEALESGEHSPMSQAKILQTMGEICIKNSEAIRRHMVDAVDQRLERQFLDHQNSQLLKVMHDA